MPNLLILHPNYPGQFARLAAAVAKCEGWTVVGVGDGERGPEFVAPARYLSYGSFVSPPETSFPPLEQLGENVRRGRAVAETLRDLKRKGFHPDVVLAHPGWGEAFFLEDVYPHAKLVAYMEHFYRGRDSDVDFDPEFPTPPGDVGYVPLRNTPSLLAHAVAERSITPTVWQAGTFPTAIRTGLTVLHEGIDTDAVAPDPAARLALADGRTLTRTDEVLTFVARSLEPYRGFHVFMRALPDIMRRRPRLTVVIVGGDGVSYGRGPGGGRTWREAMLAEVGAAVDLSRVVFMGRVPYDTYRTTLAVSSVHVYLTYPFVLSWSLLEAMATGCAVVASSTGPVTEVITDAENGRLVEFFDRKSLADTIEALLDDPRQRERLGRAARQTVIDSYDFNTRCFPRYLAMLSELAGDAG